MSNATSYDAIVIGGGASGLAAALSAARAGARTAILERDVACGIKLLATGNGRCNLSNRSLAPNRYTHPDFVSTVMGPGPEAQLTRFFDSVGIYTAEEDGRLYPYSRRAESVRDALLDACSRAGVDILCNSAIKQAIQIGSTWELEVERPSGPLQVKHQHDRKSTFRAMRKAADAAQHVTITYRASSLILAAGGNPADIVNLLDLPLNPCRPVLCPVQGTILGCDHALRDLNGQRVQGRLSLHRNGQLTWSEEGEILFRPYGISGVVVFNLSRRVAPGDTVSLDLFPCMTREELIALLHHREAAIGAFSPKDPSWFDGMLAPSLARVICELYTRNHPGSADIADVAALCKQITISVQGTADEASAQVMRGGVPVSDISPVTLAYEGCDASNLFLCGEAIDVDADCGGFSLAWAWLSGIRAGGSAASDRAERKEHA